LVAKKSLTKNKMLLHLKTTIMNRVTKFLKPLITLSLATAIFSFAGQAQDTFTPFDVMEISHTVKDYGTWRPAFDADSVYRKGSGLEKLVVGQGQDKPNDIFIALMASDVKKAKDFSADPRLKEVMGQAGVISKPDIQYFRVIRMNVESKETKWVIVTHKVKNFDKWLKAYDGEGKQKRASEGMIDVALARGVDDPNLVQIVFDITDLDKAKAAIFSEEKKKLMTSAGVQGVPKIEFYNTAE
jgi:hypothetical protein